MTAQPDREPDDRSLDRIFERVRDRGAPAHERAECVALAVDRLIDTVVRTQRTRPR